MVDCQFSYMVLSRSGEMLRFVGGFTTQGDAIAAGQAEMYRLDDVGLANAGVKIVYVNDAYVIFKGRPHEA